MQTNILLASLIMIASIFLVNHVASHVGHEGCRNLNAILFLVVLKQSGHDSGQSQS